jgi:DNA-binding SARP family transcriptional activator
MLFDILGPLRVADGSGTRPVAGVRQRILLGALLAHANQPVRAEQLAEFVWDGAPPGRSVPTLRTYVARLRQDLGPAAASRILTRDGGYLAEVGSAELDALAFETLCRETGNAIRVADWAEASNHAARALALWRAAPLVDVPSQVLRDAWLPRLDQKRVQVTEWHAKAGLHLGRHEDLVPQLRQLTADHPLHERFHAQLMQALAGCGRRAEALAAYQDARKVLTGELGIEPGRDLQRLRERILAGDGDPAAPQPSGGPESGSTPVTAVPRQPPAAAGQFRRGEVDLIIGGPAWNSPEPIIPRELPAPVAHFAGRAAELARLTALLDQPAGQPPGALVISAIGGTGGVGKTALAVHWAHQVAGRFPDGQLYVNLRGYDPGQPVAATDVLARFLRALGIPGKDIPPGEDERAARYRSRLADKHMLIVLDNASSAGQVRPLLPGTPLCAVVVTSRDALAGLVARDGAVRLDLDLLPPQEAVGLLRTLIGARVDAEPETAALLAEQCSRLPLALRVAAVLADARSDAPLARLVGELADQQKRLSLLDAGGDPRTSVLAVFSWSYRRLDARAARAFRLIGLHPGADFGHHAVAALTSGTLAESRGVLDLLARAHLIQQAGPGRYGMHDLLRAYARELAAALDDEDGHAALTRLLDYYLHSAAAAADTLYPAERHRGPRIPPATTLAPPVTEPTAAQAWLDAERANLVAVTAHAAGHGWSAHATRLAATLFRYLAAGCHSQEAITIYTHARAAARLTSPGGSAAGQGEPGRGAGRSQQAGGGLELGPQRWLVQPAEGRRPAPKPTPASARLCIRNRKAMVEETDGGGDICPFDDMPF